MSIWNKVREVLKSLPVSCIINSIWLYRWDVCLCCIKKPKETLLKAQDTIPERFRGEHVCQICLISQHRNKHPVSLSSYLTVSSVKQGWHSASYITFLMAILSHKRRRVIFISCALSLIFSLSLASSLSPSCFHSRSTGVKENHVIISIDSCQRQTPCKQVHGTAAATQPVWTHTCKWAAVQQHI